MKINRIYLLILSLAALFIATSCEKFLHIQPKGDILPSKFEDYDRLLNGYAVLKSGDPYIGFMLDDVFVSDEIGSEGPILYSLEQEKRNFYTFSPVIYGENMGDLLWEGSYERIHYYNIVIDGILEVPDASEKQKLALRAEAQMGRAYEYLNLVTAYGKIYNPATAPNDPGVPLILEADITLRNLTRASVEEIDSQILTDLAEANKHLPLQHRNSFRGSSAAGLGILARAYLYMGNYPEALNYANQSLTQNTFILDYNDPEIYKDEDWQNVMGMPQAKDNRENIYTRFAEASYGLSFEVYASSDLLSFYSPDDLRFSLFFSRTVNNITYNWDMYTAQLEVNTGINVPEVMLTAAECEARIGDYNRAVELVNTLAEKRTKAGAFTPYTAADAEEALRLVLAERRREFAMTGMQRLVDLKRLNQDPRFAKAITRDINGEILTLEPNSPLYQLPIPANVLRFNPNMQQNPR